MTGFPPVDLDLGHGFRPRTSVYAGPPIPDVRWQCPGCGRFVPEDAVQSEDYRDPGAYHGISSRRWVDCRRCGRVENPRPVQAGRGASKTPAGRSGDI